MDQELKNLLTENIRLSTENNEMLKKVIRAQKFAQIYRVVYWVIIIMVSFGSFYFIEPYLGSLINLYSGGVSNVDNISNIGKNIPDAQHLQDLVKQLNQ